MKPLRLAAAAAAALLAASLPAVSHAQTAADSAAVTRALLDYLEGFYEGDSTKMLRSIRPEVYKYGFYRAQDSTSYRGMQMQWTGFLGVARHVKEGRRRTPANAPKEVRIFEVQDQTAAGKVTAYWGTDYLLLAKYDGRWMISHVIWQSPPPGARAAGR
jgi:hypothetical protein